MTQHVASKKPRATSCAPYRTPKIRNSVIPQQNFLSIQLLQAVKFCYSLTFSFYCIVLPWRNHDFCIDRMTIRTGPCKEVVMNYADVLRFDLADEERCFAFCLCCSATLFSRVLFCFGRPFVLTLRGFRMFCDV